MIDSEYQAMASEITRIANATDFNGIHLFDCNLSRSTHDGAGMSSTGKMKIHFGTANDSAEDYYYIQIGNCTASALGRQRSQCHGRADFQPGEGLWRAKHVELRVGGGELCPPACKVSFRRPTPCPRWPCRSLAGSFLRGKGALGRA